MQDFSTGAAVFDKIVFNGLSTKTSFHVLCDVSLSLSESKKNKKNKKIKKSKTKKTSLKSCASEENKEF